MYVILILSLGFFLEPWHKRTLRSSTTRVWELTLTSPCTSPSCPRRRDAAHEPWRGLSARSSSITSSFLVTSSFREAAEKPLVWGNFCNRPISSSRFTIRAPSQVRTDYSDGYMLLQNSSVRLILSLEERLFSAVANRCNCLNSLQRSFWELLFPLCKELRFLRYQLIKITFKMKG